MSPTTCARPGRLASCRRGWFHRHLRHRATAGGVLFPPGRQAECATRTHGARAAIRAKACGKRGGCGGRGRQLPPPTPATTPPLRSTSDQGHNTEAHTARGPVRVSAPPRGRRRSESPVPGTLRSNPVLNNTVTAGFAGLCDSPNVSKTAPFFLTPRAKAFTATGCPRRHRSTRRRGAVWPPVPPPPVLRVGRHQGQACAKVRDWQ